VTEADHGLHRLGLALIAIGLLLLASPLYLPSAATVYLVDPNDVWNRVVSPGGSPSAPEVIISSATTVPFLGAFTRATSSWSLPGSCSTYVVKAQVYDGSTLKTTVTWSGSMLQTRTDGADTLCDLVVQSVPIAGNFVKDRVYTVRWTLEVRDSSGSLLGTITKPTDSAFVLKDVPSVKWYINNIEVGPSSELVTQAPLSFKMVVVSGDASMIQAVKVKMMKGTTVLADITLSKTGTQTWEGSWNTSEKGRITVGGRFIINNVEYYTLNILLGLDGGGGGGGLQGLTPLQLVGLLSLLAGMALVVMRRER
jgi:hypothetical protein